ncbi:unnamed protein product [Aureobasidium pullulans]|nr:unnamed protein product [Aureobasidium pullulans]CAD0051616.1 unnamed protein product [Aureobasidium pullulans]
MANRAASLDDQVHTIADLRDAANNKMTKMYRDYFNEGSMDLITLKDNEEAYNRYRLRPRVMTRVGNLDTSAEIFGQKVSFPFGFSPAAMHAIVDPEGEVATSRAAAHYNICMGLSSYSTKSIEEVKAAGGSNPYGIQICFHKDRTRTLNVIRRAEAAGYKALFLSVDIPVLGLRLNEYRNSFTLPEGLSWPNFQQTSDPLTESDYADLDYDADFTWEDSLAWLREHTKMEIWLKGILTPEDVSLAIAHGADGVLISNHGGRQLDGVPATLDALRECAPVAANKIKIAVDGGIRRGSDIFKALALGADFCFAGRIPIWGLASDVLASMTDDPITVNEIACLAKENLNPDVWNYYECGADDGLALDKNTPAGYKALVVTVDTPVLGNRWNERKTPLVLPSRLRLANLEPVGSAERKLEGRKPSLNRLLMDARTAEQAQTLIQSAGPSMHSSSITWASTLPWLRKVTNMKIILKGIMTEEDALLAVEHGVDGILVSNHGGRQLGCSPSTIEALPEIAKAVNGRIPILFDGGIRRGSDIFKALALGADFVLIGRPVLYGLGYKGREGVETVMHILERELSRTMALAGVTSISQIRSHSLGVSRANDMGISKL